MARRRKPNKRKQAQRAVQAEAAQTSMTRRDLMRLARNGAIGAVVIGGAGFGAERYFSASAAEHDLSRIGKGKPTVVQIHDPMCSMCRELQRETRKAMRDFGECDLVYLIADINRDDGRALALEHGVGNVTLLIFDGQGEWRETVQGVHSRGELRQTLRRHLAPGTSSA